MQLWISESCFQWMSIPFLDINVWPLIKIEKLWVESDLTCETKNFISYS